MQKKLIALAVAALASTGAMAQVTFYGVLDAGVVRATGKQASGQDQKFSGVAPGVLSGNRLGFTAEEDLGDGLKGIGRYEFGTLAIDSGNANNNGIDSTRQSFVGLSSANLGQVVLGRVQTPGYDASVKHDALGGSTVFSPLNILAKDVALSQTIHNGARVNNAIAYTSPKIAGSTTVKAAAARNGSELSTSTSNGDILTFGVEFSQGPLDVSFVLTNAEELAIPTTTIQGVNVIPANTVAKDSQEMLVGVNYNLGVAKVMAQYITTKHENATLGEAKGKFFQVGAQVPVGKGTVKLAVGRAEIDEDDIDAATTFGIDYEHAFGKRTTGFVGLSNTKVGDFDNVRVSSVGASADESITAIAAGVRLTF